MIRGIIVASLLALVVGPAVCRADVWNIDADHATVHFKVKHMMLSNVNGELSGMKGTFDLDGKDAKKWKADVTVDPATLSTHNEKRDAHLKSPDFLDVKKYPTITFKSEKFEKSGDGYKLIGKLTLHGVTKQVTWNMDSLTDAMKDPWGNLRRGFSATTKISRGEFGLKWNKALETGGVVVGDEVTLTTEGELMKKADKAEKKG